MRFVSVRELVETTCRVHRLNIDEDTRWRIALEAWGAHENRVNLKYDPLVDILRERLEPYSKAALASAI